MNGMLTVRTCYRSLFLYGNEQKIVFYLTVNSKRAKKNHPARERYVETVLLMVERMSQRQKKDGGMKTRAQRGTAKDPEKNWNQPR